MGEEQRRNKGRNTDRRSRDSRVQFVSVKPCYYPPSVKKKKKKKKVIIHLDGP